MLAFEATLTWGCESRLWNEGKPVILYSLRPKSRVKMAALCRCRFNLTLKSGEWAAAVHQQLCFVSLATWGQRRGLLEWRVFRAGLAVEASWGLCLQTRACFNIQKTHSCINAWHYKLFWGNLLSWGDECLSFSAKFKPECLFSRHLSIPGAKQRRQQDTAGEKKKAFVVIWSYFL